MNRSFVTLLITSFGLSLHAQSDATISKKENPNAPLTGQYELEGSIIQFALRGKKLVLAVPGAPLQALKPVGKNKFQSEVFQDQYFIFTEEGGSVTGVSSEAPGRILKGRKIKDDVVLSSIAMDSILTLTESTEHFQFLFSPFDSANIDSIARDMEKNYQRILTDFKVKQMPKVSVRVYPALENFHQGINFPNAPDQLLATAFGKDEIRMVSPKNAGPEGWMLAYFAPHEFTHCVHLNIDYAPNNPRWLWEGVAQFEAGWFFNPKEFDFMQKKEFPPFKDLNNGLEYMLGYAIIEAIKDTWGFDAVIDLIKARGDVKRVLGIEQKVFEEKVYKRIYDKYCVK